MCGRRGGPLGGNAEEDGKVMKKSIELEGFGTGTDLGGVGWPR